MGVQYHYLRRLVRGEVLLQFDSFSDNMKGTETLNIDYFIRGLAQYFPPVNSLSKQKHAMRHGI